MVGGGFEEEATWRFGGLKPAQNAGVGKAEAVSSRVTHLGSYQERGPEGVAAKVARPGLG